jgi:hypothetical protein
MYSQDHTRALKVDYPELTGCSWIAAQLETMYFNVQGANRTFPDEKQ